MNRCDVYAVACCCADNSTYRLYAALMNEILIQFCHNFWGRSCEFENKTKFIVYYLRLTQFKQINLVQIFEYICALAICVEWQMAFVNLNMNIEHIPAFIIILSYFTFLWRTLTAPGTTINTITCTTCAAWTTKNRSAWTKLSAFVHFHWIGKCVWEYAWMDNAGTTSHTASHRKLAQSTTINIVQLHAHANFLNTLYIFEKSSVMVCLVEPLFSLSFRFVHCF